MRIIIENVCPLPLTAAPVSKPSAPTVPAAPLSDEDKARLARVRTYYATSGFVELVDDSGYLVRLIVDREVGASVGENPLAAAAAESGKLSEAKTAAMREWQTRRPIMNCIPRVPQFDVRMTPQLQVPLRANTVQALHETKIVESITAALTAFCVYATPMFQPPLLMLLAHKIATTATHSAYENSWQIAGEYEKYLRAMQLYGGREMSMRAQEVRRRCHEHFEQKRDDLARLACDEQMSDEQFEHELWMHTVHLVMFYEAALLGVLDIHCPDDQRRFELLSNGTRPPHADVPAQFFRIGKRVDADAAAETAQQPTSEVAFDLFETCSQHHQHCAQVWRALQERDGEAPADVPAYAGGADPLYFTRHARAVLRYHLKRNPPKEAPAPAKAAAAAFSPGAGAASYPPDPKKNTRKRLDRRATAKPPVRTQK